MMLTRYRLGGRIAALALAVLLVPAPQARATPAADFNAENAAAMDRMMAGMAAAPTGDINTDFVNMMEPHHAGAVAMAVAYLRHGRNEQLRRLAQEIIVEQRQEIDAMRLAIGRPLLPAEPVPTQPPAAGHHPPAHHQQEPHP